MRCHPLSSLLIVIALLEHKPAAAAHHAPQPGTRHASHHIVTMPPLTLGCHLHRNEAHAHGVRLPIPPGTFSQRRQGRPSAEPEWQQRELAERDVAQQSRINARPNATHAYNQDQRRQQQPASCARSLSEKNVSKRRCRATRSIPPTAPIDACSGVRRGESSFAYILWCLSASCLQRKACER
jgi:hypothetical protein